MVFAKNGWYTKQQAANFAARACTGAGAFKGIYQLIASGKAVPDEKAYMVSEIAMSAGREAKTVTAHLFVLKNSESLLAKTFI